MIRGDVVLDTNLSLLLIVGSTNPSLIEKHKRLRAFDAIDFQMLRSALELSSGISVSPNISTEISNLLFFSAGANQQRLMQIFHRFLERTSERYIPSVNAKARKEFSWLGLSDAVILEMAESKSTILTADAKLHIAAQNAGLRSENFNHWKDRRPDYQI